MISDQTLISSLYGEELAHKIIQSQAPISSYLEAVKDAHLTSNRDWKILDNLRTADSLAKDNDQNRVVSFCEKLNEYSWINLRDWGYGCFTRYHSQLYIYRHTHFVEVGEDFMIHALQILGLAFDLKPENYLKAKFIEDCKKQMLVSAQAAELPPPTECVVNFLNGTYKFTDEGKAIKNISDKPIFFFDYRLPFEFDQFAECPDFDNFLSEVVGEKECISFLYEFLGSAFFTPNEILRVNREKGLILHGIGANGKSVFFNVCKALFGKDQVSHLSPTDLKSEFMRYGLNNKKINWCSDADSGWQSSLMKQLVSREPTEANVKNKTPVTMDRLPVQVVNTNELPSADDVTNGWFRRFDIVHFEKSIPREKQQPNLAADLKLELPGIFNKVMKGRYRLLENKDFTTSPKINKANAEYENFENTAKAFIEAKQMVRDANLRIGKGDAFGDYQKWCAVNACKSLSQRKFNGYLGTKFEEIKSSNVYWCARYS